MTFPVLSIATVLVASPEIPYEAEIDAALAETAAIYPVPKSLVIAVISVESGFHPRALSPAGAKGLMQLMPYTARRVGIAESHIYEPASNILGGVRLLAVLLRHYEGDVISALIAYNARPRQPLAPIPKNGETHAYIYRLLHRLRRCEDFIVRRSNSRGLCAMPRLGRRSRPSAPSLPVTRRLPVSPFAGLGDPTGMRRATWFLLPREKG